MPNLFLTLDWFQGIDLIFEFVALFVALLIAGYSWKAYRMSEEHKFKYFSLAFLLISLSLFVKALTSSAVYFQGTRIAADAVLRPALGAAREYSILFYHAGFFVEMAAMLGGWLLLFFVSQKARDRLKKYHEVSQLGLFVYLVLLISWVANFKYEVFYLTGAVLLGLITLNYYKNYLNNNNRNTLLVMDSFILLLVAHLFFIFMFVTPFFYVFGQISLLLGFILLLYTYMRVKHR